MNFLSPIAGLLLAAAVLTASVAALVPEAPVAERPCPVNVCGERRLKTCGPTRHSSVCVGDGCWCCRS